MVSKILCAAAPFQEKNPRLTLRRCAFARKNITRLAPILLYLLSLTSCFEPQEGCLDISAVNFDASADKDCDKSGCACIYPKLQVAVDQR